MMMMSDVDGGRCCAEDSLTVATQSYDPRDGFEAGNARSTPIRREIAVVHRTNRQRLGVRQYSH